MGKGTLTILVLILILGAGLFFGAFNDRGAYQALALTQKVVKIAENLGPVTRLQITPDDELMLATTLNGTVYALTHEQKASYALQKEPFYKVEHGWAEGFENGLTGLIVGADYENTHHVFLTYNQRLGSLGENRILRLTVTEKDGKYIGAEPRLIFRGSTTMAGAHQIQGGESLMLEGKPHLLFTIGEGYQPEQASDLDYEAGKIMLIQENGQNPLGARPYPTRPRIQAIGIRNSYDLAISQDTGWVYWTENGPDENDRIAYAPLLDPEKIFDLGWDGTPESMAMIVIDSMNHPEYILRLYTPTVAPTDILSLGGDRFLYNIFSSVSYPHKEIIRGQIQADGTAHFTKIVIRKSSAKGGNLLGLAKDSQDNIYFGDFADGDIYILTNRFNRIS